jgi:TolB-like protein/class 3 adenylate cyclase/cytochrome c-type biogenesis protein CcmH/NrfG
VREQRKLAAIVAADVVGYSRLMGRDESGALLRLRKHRSECFDPALARNGGRVVKLTGDGVLAEFGSAVDAVRAAVEIQQAVAEANQDQAEEDRMVFRIGLHLGDLIIDGDDLYGDGVNVAARLEGEAPAGGIVLSGAVHDAMAGKLKTTLHDLGELALKNIERPVRAFRVEWDPADWPVGQFSTLQTSPGPPLSLPGKPSIAVLAFNNLSGDPQQEYFSDGITEDVISSLSRHHGIFVIARNSSFAYKGQSIDVGRIGRDLGVRYVLEGSVRRAGDRVRVTAQLVEAEHRTHIWADRYDRDLNDFFSVQDEITRNIVATVAPELLEAEMQRVRRKDPSTLGAWECAMRAEWHLARLTKEDVAEAISLATKATALDPGTTWGFNIAAFAHLYEVAYGWAASLPQSVLAAYQSASQAVALDSRDAVSQTALAACEVFMKRPEDAIARLKTAIDLNPNFTWAHGNLGLALACLGRGDEAVPAFREALRLSPRDHFNFLWLYLMGFALFVAGHYEEALVCTEKSMRENASVPGVYRLRAACLSQLDRIDEARTAFADFMRRSPDATVASTKTQIPLTRPEDLERYVESLRRAGLRDG